MAIEVEGDVLPYESATLLGTQIDFSYLPEESKLRAEAYKKYDQLYWNDRGQYTLRVLEGEEPTYIPNPKTVVDSTAHFLLKGLRVSPKDPENPSGRVDQDEVSGSPEDRKPAKSMGDALQAFLDREMFYARFQNAKHAGVARGDWAFHMTGDPDAEEGKRLSLNPVAPWKVILDQDPDDATRVIRAHLVELVAHPQDATKRVVKELLYDYGEEEETSTGQPSIVYRTETLWSLDKPWYDLEERIQVGVTLPREALPTPISIIPVYLFHNINWDGGLYGVSELKGFEKTLQAISQVATDQGAALALEGLGVYVTDGGRPVNNDGKEIDWNISPGQVAELTSGAYLRRVEGVGSVKPTMDHIEYLESKIREAGGISDISLGRIDVQTAESGIALAIKFMPTLAKTEGRDELGIGKLKQLFYDWKAWHEAYEGTHFEEEIVVTIGDKLPSNRTERVNELNNMLDRKIISKRYYRSEMQKLGYIFPDDMEDEIAEEAKREAELKALMAPPELQDNAAAAAGGEMPPPPNPNQPGIKTPPKEVPNRSNNAGRVNESSGTEATQSVAKQARGAKAPQPVNA